MLPLILHSQALVDICHQHDVAKLSLFGSTARGEATEHSDVDLQRFAVK
jgi:predicted nucleotidyltransferase